MEEDFSKYNGEGTLLRKVQKRLLDIMIEVDRICRKHGINYWLAFGTLLGAVRHSGFIPWDDDIDIAIMYKDLNKLKKVLKAELPEHYVVQDYSTDKSYFLDSVLKIRDKKSYFPIDVYKTFKEQGILIDIIPMEKMPSARFKKIVRKVNKHPYLRRKQISLEGKSSDILGLFLSPIAWLLIEFAHLYSHLSSTHLMGYNYLFILKQYGEIQLDRDEIFPLKIMKFEGKEFYVPNKIHEFLVHFYGDNYMQIPQPEDRQLHSTNFEIYD